MPIDLGAGLSVQVALPAAPTIIAPSPVTGALVVVPVAGVPGPPGAAGGGAFRWNQTTPATVWTIVHNLGRYPAVATVHSADLSVSYVGFGIQHIDVNTLRLSMDIATAGVALLI